MSTNRNKIARRSFLKATSASVAMAMTGRASADDENDQPIELSQSHQEAVNRRRRISVQYDAYNCLGKDFDRWLAFRFSYADEPGTQIDGLWWDISPLEPGVYPNPPGRTVWNDWPGGGIDLIARLVEETRKRNLECFWNHRVSEVDLNPDGIGAAWKTPAHPFKQAHPDWVLKTWWRHGLWNLAVPELRQYKVGHLRGLAEKYNLDGFQLDFARHVPCLPPGRQWELRHHATRFVRMVRLMLLDVEKKRGRPMLLAAKVPRNLDGCRVDGFDVRTWAQQNLVDIFTLGSRSIDVDVAAYRRIVQGRNIKLQPCFDDHHTTDGYGYPPIEVFRGVFGNWWQQGADSVATFNWSNAPPDVCEKIDAKPGPLSQRRAYQEVGNPQSLKFKDKTFVVERRGGYPWAEGFFNRNHTAPLPAVLADDGQATTLTVRICDDLAALAERLRQVKLRVILFGASDGDEFEVRLGGSVLSPVERDATWKDPQIFSPRPQPASGGHGNYKIDPKQKLLRLEYAVDPKQCRLGENSAEVRIVKRTKSQPAAAVQLEKLEVLVRYS